MGARDQTFLSWQFIENSHLTEIGIKVINTLGTTGLDHVIALVFNCN